MFDHYEPIPPDLDRMPPGPTLAAFLASIDVDRVSGHDRVLVLRAHHRMVVHHAAQTYAAMASVADHMEADLLPDDAALAWEAAATEIRAALRLTRRSAEAELDRALAIRHRLPRVWEAMKRGLIDWRRAAVIVRGTASLDETTARRVVDAVIDDAAGLTTGELASMLRRLGIEADPQRAADGYRDAVEQRRLVLEASPDGTANLLGLDLPPHLATAAARRIDRLAKTLNRTGEPRTIDQLRADVLLDLLCGTADDSTAGIVEILVPLDTLADLSNAPGELAGYGPVIADIARQVAESRVDGEWRFTITDPTTGLPVHDGTTRRRPTVAQRRTVAARDRTCTFPGCRMPATQCDLDHRTPWAQEQQTAVDGLDPACRHDHITVRHSIGWTRRPLPGGDHLWTSPLGHRYTKSGRPP
jgi:hypothetical protein